MTTLSDSVRRAARTFLQAFLGSITTTGILSTISQEGVVDWSILRKIVVAAIASGVIALFTLLQNSLEDRGTIPALLKAPASEGENPIPDPSA